MGSKLHARVKPGGYSGPYSECDLVGIDPQRGAAAVPEFSGSGAWEFRSVYDADDTRLRLLMETLLAEVECRGEMAGSSRRPFS